jgi:hypothetical protein
MGKIFNLIISSIITLFTVFTFVAMTTSVIVLITEWVVDDLVTRVWVVIALIAILFWATMGSIYLPEVIYKIISKRGKKNGS